MYYYLYQITNKINGNVYIGVHKTNNLNDGYMGSGKYLNNAINKYGIENFEKKILKEFDTEKEMYQEESEIVNEKWVKRKDTYNIKLGGYGGWDYANKSLEKKYGVDYIKIIQEKGNKSLEKKYGSGYYKIMSKRGRKSLEKKYGVDCYKIIGDISVKIMKEKYPDGVWKGKKHTDESKRKIGKANSIHQKGENNSQYGTCWIYNLELKENKKISKDELEKWIEKGWLKGRKMKF